MGKVDDNAEAKPPTLGLLLAGGLARRMGGGDKGLRHVGQSTILSRVIERLGPQCEELLLNANGDPSRLDSFGLPVVGDSYGDHAGPLAGILAGLDWAAEHRPDIRWLISSATDCPFLPRDLVSRLHEARAAENAELAVAASGSQSHHVVALWKVDLRHELRRALVEEGQRSVHRWTARYHVATATWPTEPFDPFFNVNTADDLATAETLAVLDDQ